MEEASRETSPLDPIQLSNDELRIIKDIESRLAEKPSSGENLYQRTTVLLTPGGDSSPESDAAGRWAWYREDIVAAHACEALALQVRQ